MKKMVLAVMVFVMAFGTVAPSFAEGSFRVMFGTGGPNAGSCGNDEQQFNDSFYVRINKLSRELFGNEAPKYTGNVSEDMNVFLFKFFGDEAPQIKAGFSPDFFGVVKGMIRFFFPGINDYTVGDLREWVSDQIGIEIPDLLGMDDEALGNLILDILEALLGLAITAANS